MGFYVIDNVTGARMSRDFDTSDKAASLCRTFNSQPGGRYGVAGEDDRSNMDQIKAALREHNDKVIDMVAAHIAHLGSKLEWSMDDNFNVTEDTARLAAQVGLPSAGDQSDEALAFYEEAANG